MVRDKNLSVLSSPSVIEGIAGDAEGSGNATTSLTKMVEEEEGEVEERDVPSKGSKLPNLDTPLPSPKPLPMPQYATPTSHMGVHMPSEDHLKRLLNEVFAGST